MNSEAISAIIAKHATLKTSKAKLEAMEAGTYVVHRSWGFGQIKEYDESDMKLVIDFKGKKSHRMDPAFCVTSMEVLPAKHILARKETEPKVIKALIEDDPMQLVIDTLSAYPNKAATAIELEIVLTQVVGEENLNAGSPALKSSSLKTRGSGSQPRKPTATLFAPSLFPLSRKSWRNSRTLGQPAAAFP